MSSRCLSSECLNGNCEGCKNKSKFCDDPRCFPNCPDCSGETSSTTVPKRTGLDWAIIIIIGVLSVALLVLLVIIGWRWSCSGDKVTKKCKKKCKKKCNKTKPVRRNYQRLQVQVPVVTPIVTPIAQTIVSQVPAPIVTPIAQTNIIETMFQELPIIPPAPRLNDIDIDLSLDVGDIPDFSPVIQDEVLVDENVSFLPDVPSISKFDLSDVSVASAKPIPISIPIPKTNNNNEIRGFN